MGNDKKKTIDPAELRKKLLQIGVGVLVLGGVSFGLAYNCSGTLRGKIKVMMWGGDGTLFCGDGDVIVIEDKTVDHHGSVIYARTGCTVTLRRVDFTGTHAVYLYRGAKLTVVDSTLTGSSGGIYLQEGATATIKNTKIRGKSNPLYLSRGAKATMTGGLLESPGKSVAHVNDGAVLELKGTEVRGHPPYVSNKGIAKGVVMKHLDDRITCRGNLEMSVVGAKAATGRGYLIYASDRCRLTIDSADLTSSGTVVMARDQAQVTVKRSTLRGKYGVVRVRAHGQVALDNTIVIGESAIVARGDAKIGIKGGGLRGKRVAISVRDRAEVNVSGTKIEGKVQARGNAVVNGVEEVSGGPTRGIGGTMGGMGGKDGGHEEPTGLAAKLKRYERYACGGFLGCYKDNDHFGNVAARIKMKIGPKGKVQGVQVQLKGKPGRKITRCVTSVAKKKQIADFDGPPGTLECTMVGKLGRSFTMLNRGGKYLLEDKKKGK